MISNISTAKVLNGARGTDGGIVEGTGEEKNKKIDLLGCGDKKHRNFVIVCNIMSGRGAIA